MEVDETIYYLTNSELKHHGVLGQKWGVRRYQNADGSLTAAGKKKYHTNSVLGNVGRAVTNTSVGQRLLGVGINRGYREDRKEIKELYKSKQAKINESNASDEDKKAELKSLKSDYRKTKGEARVSAAEVLYSHQSSAANTKIQTQNLGKQFAKGLLMSGYGTLNYDRLTATGNDRVTSALVGVGSAFVDGATRGAVSIADYAVGRTYYNRKNK